MSLHFSSEVALFAPGSSHPVEVEVTAARANSKGTLAIGNARGLESHARETIFQLANAGEQNAVQLHRHRARSKPPPAKISASAEIGGATLSTTSASKFVTRTFPLQLLQPPARIKASSLDLAIRGKKSATCPARATRGRRLQQMGYAVTTLTTPT